MNRVGNFINNTAQQVGKSRAFQQIKNGVIQSGVLESAGNLAGSAVNGLVDVGRLKLERDLERLREKAMGSAPRTMPAYGPPVTVERPSAREPVGLPPPETAYETVEEEEAAPVGPTQAVPLGPYVPTPPTPTTPPAERVPRPTDNRRLRKRKRVSGWGAALDGMMGHGPGFYKRRYCF